MPAVNVDQLRQKATKALSGFSTGQKVVTALAIVGLVGGLFMFSSWASKPSYTPLFTNLQSSDAAAITQKLTSAKVPYQLGDNGSTVLVPQSQVYQQRMTMSAAGLPSGGQQGYQLLDKQGITTSEFSQHVGYQRALEGELSKTIGAIDGVSAATVHLVIPQNDVFAADSHKPSASVLIQNVPGKSMTSGQVQAVVHLVSSSVEGLDPGSVTVADSKGNVLSAPGDDGALATAGDTRTQQTSAFQDSMSKSLQDMLGTVIGPGHAVVKVTADLDYDQRATTTETYDTAKQAPALTETTSKEQYAGTATGTQVGGLLGNTTTTIPNAANPGNSTNYSKDDASRTFAVGKVTSQVKQAPGAVKRLSVAVALDDKAKVDKATVERLVTAAAGIDANRGDAVVVDTMTFDDTAAKQAQKELKQAEAAKSREGMVGTAKTAGILLVVLAVIFALLRSAKRAPRRIPIEVPEMAELEAPRTALVPAINIDEEEPVLVGAGVKAAGSLPAGPEREIVDLIERQPDEVAQLLRSWLADRRD